MNKNLTIYALSLLFIVSSLQAENTNVPLEGKELREVVHQAVGRKTNQELLETVGFTWHDHRNRVRAILQETRKALRNMATREEQEAYLNALTVNTVYPQTEEEARAAAEEVAAEEVAT